MSGKRVYNGGFGDKTRTFIEIDRKYVEKYTRSHYRVIGRYKHTSIKPCHWLGQKLLTGRNNRNCYKGYWGISSEKCIQNTPSYPFCTHNCVFCWRDSKLNLGTSFICRADDPVFLVDELIRHQRNIIEYTFPLKRQLLNYRLCRVILIYFLKNPDRKSDIGGIIGGIREIDRELSERDISKGNIMRAVLLLKTLGILRTPDFINYFLTEKIKKQGIDHTDVDEILKDFVTTPEEIRDVYYSALKPNHAAISLDGEPTLYPRLSEFISEFRKRGFTTFVVSNGTNPEAIRELYETDSLPTILYITVPAPNLSVYKYICRPRIKDGYERIMQTLGMLSELPCRTVLRITAVKNLNIGHRFIEDYRMLIDKYRPNFVDIKGFTLEGSAMGISERLGSDKEGAYYVPDFDYLMQFASELIKPGDWNIAAYHKASRDVLISVNWPENRPLILGKNEI